MSTTIFETDVGDVLGQALADVEGTPLVVNPSRETITALVSVLTEQDADRQVRVLADERALKDVFGDFIVASRAADLVTSDTLAIRAQDTAPDNALLIADDSISTFVTAGDAVAALSTSEADFVTAARDHYD